MAGQRPRFTRDQWWILAVLVVVGSYTGSNLLGKLSDSCAEVVNGVIQAP